MRVSYVSRCSGVMSSWYVPQTCCSFEKSVKMDLTTVLFLILDLNALLPTSKYSLICDEKKIIFPVVSVTKNNSFSTTYIFQRNLNVFAKCYLLNMACMVPESWLFT